MSRRTRPIVTVQGMGDVKIRPAENEHGVRYDFERAMVRLRGKWVRQLFAPGTRLQVTRELRGGKVVLVLEGLPEECS